MDMDKVAQEVRMCAACPKMCRHMCPTFFAWRSDSPTPHGRALLIHQELTDTRALDDRAIEVLYQCLECSQCLTWCLPEIDIASIVEQKRIQLVNEGRHPSGLIPINESIQVNHNPYGELHSARLSFAKDLGELSGRILYFTGCTASYRELGIARDTIELLESIGLSVSLMDDEWCCGSPLLRTGFEDEALEQAKHNVALINSLDVDEIVVTCPGCYRVLTNDYPDHGLELSKPVKHLSQLLEENLDLLPTVLRDERVTYHDPCHLARHSGVYDAPRKVISQIIGSEVTEMERTRDNAMCCGNGAGVRTLFKEKARIIGFERIEQAKRTGSSYLVTACPFCKDMLDSQSGEDIKVLDLPEFIMKAKRKLPKRS